MIKLPGRPPIKGKISKSWTIVISIYSYFVIFAFGEMVSQLWLRFLANDAHVMRFERIAKIDPVSLRYSGHPYLNYYPTPNYTDDDCRHNSLGYRGDEFDLTKPDGVYRIVLLGGSTTYSSHVTDNGSTFPALIEQMLNHYSGHENVEVINAGVSGYTSWETHANFQYRVLELKPDLVVVSLGIEDVACRLTLDYRSDNSGYRRQWSQPETRWWEYSCLLRIVTRSLHLSRSKLGIWDWMLVEGWDSDEINTTEPEKVAENFQRLAENRSAYFERNLANLILIAKANGIKVVFATEAVASKADSEGTHYLLAYHFQTALEQHAEVMRNFSNSGDALLFDFANVMPDEPGYWADHMHVNEDGSVVKAELFTEFILRSVLQPDTTIN